MVQHTSVRRSLAVLAALLAAFLAPARPAQAAYTATLAGSVATLSGDIEADNLIIDVVNNLLHHNRILFGDPNFTDNFDFDTALAGSQHLPAAAGATVHIDAGGGNDTIVVGDLALVAGIVITIDGGAGDDEARISAPFRGLAQVSFDGGAGSDSLLYDERADSAARNIAITASQVSMDGGIAASYARVEGILVNAGLGADTITVRSTAATTPVEINNLSGSSSSIDAVNIGDSGSTQQILGDILVLNLAAFTQLTVDDSASTMGRAITIANGTIDGIAPATLAYGVANQIRRVTVKSGGGADTFAINSTITTLPLSLMSGGGDDRFVFADGATLTGLGTIDGGAGTDTLDYAAYTTSVYVDAGGATGTQSPNGVPNIESAIGGSADDTLFARAGVDYTLRGNGGADIIQGSSGNDTLIGGAGADMLRGGEGDDLLIWADGDAIDTVIEGDAGTNDRLELSGGPSADLFTIGAIGGQAVITRSLPLSETLRASTIERLSLGGGGGDDTLTIAGAPPGLAAITLHGDAGDDELLGGPAADTLVGGADDDTLAGGAGADTLAGDAGNDTLDGDAGADTLRGDAGSDALDGGSGDDALDGGSGDDALDGGAGGDTLAGGPDADTLNGGAGADTLAWNDDDGSDAVEGGAGADTLHIAGSATLGDRFSILPAGARFKVTRSLPTPSALDVGTTETLSVASGGGDDTFDVVALPTTTIALDGGPHSAGDALIFYSQGLTVTHTLGKISVPNRQPLTYVRIEQVKIQGSGSGPEQKIFIPLVRR